MQEMLEPGGARSRCRVLEESCDAKQKAGHHPPLSFVHLCPVPLHVPIVAGPSTHRDPHYLCPALLDSSATDKLKQTHGQTRRSLLPCVAHPTGAETPMWTCQVPC